jgi:hypothetical protein
MLCVKFTSFCVGFPVIPSAAFQNSPGLSFRPLRTMLWPVLETMKMLFYTSDLDEVRLATNHLAQAQIPCEIRHSPTLKAFPELPPCTELWIRNDKDCHRAFMVCVQLGIGFSRRHHACRIEDIAVASHDLTEASARVA